MTRFTKGLVLAVAALVIGSVATVPATARPNYFKEFSGHYTEVKAAAEAKCGVCHEGADKKNKNDYGKALGAVIGKSEKDSAKIKEALVKIEKEKSSVEGKTFGDLLKEGKLPSGK
jgi:hypothetical protein